MDRSDQLKILAELYSRVEDGTADLFNVTTRQDAFSNGLVVEISSTVEKGLKLSGIVGVFQTSLHSPSDYRNATSMTANYIYGEA